MSNAVSSLIFACRNVDKTQNGEVGRAPVAAAQGIKVLNEVTKYNKLLASGADATISVFNELAQKSKAVDYTMKGVKWATNNVNPLICASGGLKVLMSDDKTSTAVKEVAALSTMFAGENIAKKVLNNKDIHNKILDKASNVAPKAVTKIAPKLHGKLGTLIKGILFVGASIGSYSVGEKIGNNFADEIKANYSHTKINQMA